MIGKKCNLKLKFSKYTMLIYSEREKPLWCIGTLNLNHKLTTFVDTNCSTNYTVII